MAQPRLGRVIGRKAPTLVARTGESQTFLYNWYGVDPPMLSSA